MKNWINGLLIAVMAIGVGIGQLDASPRFEQRQPLTSARPHGKLKPERKVTHASWLKTKRLSKHERIQ